MWCDEPNFDGVLLVFHTHSHNTLVARYLVQRDRIAGDVEYFPHIARFDEQKEETEKGKKQMEQLMIKLVIEGGIMDGVGVLYFLP
mmetsp:Transcript_60603/g.69172  ORF Transcript_60603/g.69172 Transcript_60603/m.69172 type:complete len:86 (+) Transcript_60603:1590-1847(+)